MGMTWNGDAAKRDVGDKSMRKLEALAITVVNSIKESISDPSNDGQTPSAPGSPPHKDTGRLRASISHEMDHAAKTARVGTNVLYAIFLELGTRKMAARPFLRPAIAKAQSMIASLFK